MDNKTNPGDGEKTDALDRVVRVMAANGDLPAGVIAEKAGLAYSTTTPRLRALEELGVAERIRVDGRTLWRLTDHGTTDADADPDPTTPATASQPETVPAADADTDADGHATTGPEESTNADTSAAHEPTAIDTPPDGPVADAPATDGETPVCGEVPVDEEVSASSGIPVDDAVSVRDEVGLDADGAPDPVRETGPDDTQTAPVQPVEADPGEAADETVDGAGPDDTAPAEPVPAEPVPATARAAAKAVTSRRPKGALRAAVLEIMHAHPDAAYKVGELSKLLGGASAGAVANALTKLAAEGTLIQTVDKPATFQAV